MHLRQKVRREISAPPHSSLNIEKIAILHNCCNPSPWILIAYVKKNFFSIGVELVWGGVDDVIKIWKFQKNEKCPKSSNSCKNHSLRKTIFFFFYLRKFFFWSNLGKFWKSRRAFLSLFQLHQKLPHFMKIIWKINENVPQNGVIGVHFWKWGTKWGTKSLSSKSRIWLVESRPRDRTANG